MGFPAIYPFIERLEQPMAYARKAFPPGGPKGVTVHFTASPSIMSAVASFAEKGFCYHLIIGRDGKVWQTAYMTHGTWHAGVAKWNGKSPNSTHISVAVVTWGRLKPSPEGWRSFTGHVIPEAEVAVRPGNVKPTPEAWHVATAKQEKTLAEVLQWAVVNGVSPNDICGHDECALPLGRKDDPGGALSLSMRELRARLIGP